MVLAVCRIMDPPSSPTGHAKMRIIPQNPELSGFGNVKMEKSIPHLSAGLREIILAFSPGTTESTAATIYSGTTSPASTNSGRTLGTTTRSPDSTTTFSDVGNANEKPGSPESIGDSYELIFDGQHYEEFSSASSPFSAANHGLIIQPRLSLAMGFNDLTYYSHNTYQLPREMKEVVPVSCSPTRSSATTVTIGDEIIAWYPEEKQTATGAEQLSTGHHHWDLVQAFEDTPLFLKGDTASALASQPQQCRNYREVQPATDLWLSRERSPSSITVSTEQCYADLLRKSFYIKLEKYVAKDKERCLQSQGNIHVFVDMSNIFIGFCDSYKAGRHIPVQRHIKAPLFSFETFAIVMERARNVQKRILAGSTSAGISRKHWPHYLRSAEEWGYKLNIFSRVQKCRPRPEKTRRRGRVSAREMFQSSPCEGGHDSLVDSTEDEMAADIQMQNKEQGVDENLHLNMMDTMWDNIHDPGTMVLATGDAAEAEFSPGFLHYATQALDNGWNVELITWKRTTSSAWTNLDFNGKYAGKFQIIFLDEFLEDFQSEMFG
ncbi:hypothetical protein GGR54DRAFT_623410 [Hypoxylon sp. NC1633]|nr:hypothetical protein GGR54DRAFT_623410 [Hypoxylon sp. NC1633]